MWGPTNILCCFAHQRNVIATLSLFHTNPQKMVQNSDFRPEY